MNAYDVARLCMIASKHVDFDDRDFLLDMIIRSNEINNKIDRSEYDSMIADRDYWRGCAEQASNENLQWYKDRIVSLENELNRYKDRIPNCTVLPKDGSTFLLSVTWVGKDDDKIRAIKALREIVFWNLKESKMAVEEMIAGNKLMLHVTDDQQAMFTRLALGDLFLWKPI